MIRLPMVLNQGFDILTLTKFRENDELADYKCWDFEKKVAPDMPWTDPISIPEYFHYKNNILGHPRFNPESWFIVLNDNIIIGLNNLWETSINNIIGTGFTGVDRKYRKKGVATALKHFNLGWSKKMGYKTIRTTNVNLNKTMLKINLQIGFQFMPSWLVMEKKLKIK